MYLEYSSSVFNPIALVLFPNVVGIFSEFSKFGFKLVGVNAEEGQQALGDWHNLEHILYNMLVKVHLAQNASGISGIIPDLDLALLNADGDRISKDIAELRKFSFVGKDFEGVEENWNQLWTGTLIRNVYRNDQSKYLIKENVALFNVTLKKRAEEYRNIL
mmetsp:Transcript_2265/g.3082  ORF Transcript_2265/g.3082 Transcript_2265/m.3082 type:complete len:161 (+) Transcript_2265:199-681(+)